MQQQPVAINDRLVLPSGTLVFWHTEYAVPYVLAWIRVWRRRYAFERRELATYEQPDLGGEG